MIINRQEFARLDFVPATAKAAGVMVVDKSLIGYTTRDCPALEVGSIVVSGVCDGAKPDTQAWARGQNVYYDESEDNFTTEDSGNLLVGYAVDAVAEDAETGRIYFNPAIVADEGSPSGSGE